MTFLTAKIESIQNVRVSLLPDPVGYVPPNCESAVTATGHLFLRK